MSCTALASFNKESSSTDLCGLPMMLIGASSVAFSKSLVEKGSVTKFLNDASSSVWTYNLVLPSMVVTISTVAPDTRINLRTSKPRAKRQWSRVEVEARGIISPTEKLPCLNEIATIISKGNIIRHRNANKNTWAKPFLKIKFFGCTIAIFISPNLASGCS